MTRHSAPGTVVVLAVVVVAAMGPTGTAAFALGDGAQIEPDNVVLRVDLRADGEAAWTIEYWTRLEDANATAAFESVRADVRENRSAFTARFDDRIRRTVRAAENATGREMALRSVNVTTRRTAIPQEYGVLTYTFVWEGFAVVDGPRLRAGDAIAGLFLDDGTTLVVGWPAEYRLVDSDPSPDEGGPRTVTWHGPITFGDDEPRIVVTSTPATTAASTAAASPPTRTAAGTTAATGPGGGDRQGTEGLSLGPIVGAALVVALAAGVGWLYRQRRRPGTDGDEGAAVASATDDGDAAPPEELLSNEERVLQVLEEHGGRMKQQDIAEELGWTDAKTSQVVGDLRETGTIDGFRLGRENVLTLPGDDAGDETDT